jgi:hypothetical protein
VELEHFRVIPFSRITPDSCSVIAGRGEAALTKLESWGLQRPYTGSLAAAIRHLTAVARSGKFGDDPSQLRATLEAIHLCSDFYQVAASLGELPIQTAVSELAIALQGGLTGTGKARKAKEYLSQYWIGTLLAIANSEPRIVRSESNKARPDFIIDLGGLDCAIEIKRPQSFHSSRDALDHAAGQLRSYGKPGVICLDLTDCIYSDDRVELLDRGFLQARDLLWEIFQNETERLARRPEKYNQSDKYSRILGLVLFARVTGWSDSSDLRPVGKYFVQLPIYEKACGGLVSDFAARLKRIFITGFERISGSPPEPEPRHTVLSNTR